MAVRELPNFNSKIINQPLELLAQVESLIHVPIKSKYFPLTHIYVVCSVLPSKQGEKDDLINYMRGFKSGKGFLLGTICTKFLDWCTEISLEYENISTTVTATQSALKKYVIGRFMAVFFGKCRAILFRRYVIRLQKDLRE